MPPLVPSTVSPRRAVAALSLVAMTAAHAGLSLEQAVARHHVLLGGGLDAAGWPAGQGVMPAIGGPAPDVPLLMAPEVPGRGGVRLQLPPLQRSARAPTVRLAMNLYDGAHAASALEGTELRLPLAGGEVYASVERRHWGPGWAGSLILDGAAPPLPAVGWRRSPDIGGADEPPRTGWSADVFVARLGGHVQPADPYLVGMRLTWQPLAGLEFGASRVLQWGGAGRDQSLRSLMAALAGRDNPRRPGDADPGNQLAGFDVRLARPAGGGEWALYGQAVGEDEAGGLPSQWILQAGAERAGRWQGVHLRAYAEVADTVSGGAYGEAAPGTTYRHHVYRQGYTHHGVPLGHALGGDARLASVGLVVDAGRARGLLALHGGRAARDAQRFPAGARLGGLNAAASLAVSPGERVGLALWLWRTGGDGTGALQVWWHTAWR